MIFKTGDMPACITTAGISPDYYKQDEEGSVAG